MRIEDITVALRPRNPWEAVELGTALTRRHFGAVLRPWLAVSLPVFVLLNVGLALLDLAWLAGLVMWWLKPVFDRVPLFVLSRAVFGHAPGTWTSVHAQARWGLRWMPSYLTWRRPSPWRSLNLPVDLLEGGASAEASVRRTALVAPLYGVGALVTTVFSAFELVVVFGLATVGLLFVPDDSVVEVAASGWRVFAAQPLWLQVATNALAWTVTSFIEPFYVGAGFGLYLNRRTQIECWDIEMVLRRLRARLTQTVAPVLLLAALGLGLAGVAPAVQAAGQVAVAQEDFAQAGPAEEESAQEVSAQAVPAQDEETFAQDDVVEVDPAQEGTGDDPSAEDDVAEEDAAPQAPAKTHRPQGTLHEVFGEQAGRDEGWDQAVKRAYEDPKVSPHQVIQTWVPRNPSKPRKMDGDWAWLAHLFALVGEYGIWVVVALLVLALLATAPRWIGWLRDSAAREARESSPVVVEEAPPPDPLPSDVPAAVLRLWQQGHERDALALMYRASVEDMARRANVVLPPGATEAHTLRASRKLPRARDREVFADTVRTWQYAAYAHGLPTAQDFEALLRALVQAFGWPTATGLDRAAPEGAA